METNYKLYVHINKIDGKKYYGITSEKNPNRRWKNGKGYQNNRYFTRAIEKHGWENFEHIILFENLTKSEAHALEIEHIAKYKTKNREFGYNLTDGGESANGLKHTEESKQKMSESKKGKHISEETKQKISIAMEGRQFTEETKKKMSESQKGKKLSEETKKKISKNNSRYWTGKQRTEETKRKMSESLKGKYVGENHHSYGKQLTAEHKQKLSENHADFSGKNHPGAKSVICITTRKIFFTAKEGAEYYNSHSQNISKCCIGKRKSAGTYNGQKLVWRYLNHKHNFTYRIKRTMES